VLAAVGDLDPATAAYKDLAAWSAPLIAWLEDVAGRPPSRPTPQDHE
jgi:hypothetical protein